MSFAKSILEDESLRLNKRVTAFTGAHYCEFISQEEGKTGFSKKNIVTWRVKVEGSDNSAVPEGFVGTLAAVEHGKKSQAFFKRDVCNMLESITGLSLRNEKDLVQAYDDVAKGKYKGAKLGIKVWMDEGSDGKEYPRFVASSVS